MRITTLLTAAALLLTPAWSTGAIAQAGSVVPGEEHCVVNVRSNDSLNIRAAANSRSAIAAKKAYGECGIIVTGQCKGVWCPVEDGHVTGFAHSRYLSMVSPALYCVTGVADDDVLNLRAFPSTTSRVLAELAPNACDIAFLPYAQGRWQKVRAAGWEGWVNRKFLSGE